MNDQTVVLLHGAGVGAWIWDRVTPLISAPTFSLDVPGRSRDATPATCASSIVDTLDGRGISRVVLVMHSLAGVLAGELGKRLHDRLATCIYVSAVIPGEGSTFVKAVGLPGRLLLPLLFRMKPNGLRPSASMLRKELCTDLVEQDCAMILQRYEAEFPGLYLSPVAGPPACRSAYVRLLKDASLSPARQSTMIGRLHIPQVWEIDAGHLAMLSRPKELAAVINDVMGSETAAAEIVA
jgi:pimeloyl-ACP methyl ester carboxylesterase